MGKTRDLEGPGNEKWLIGRTMDSLTQIIAAPIHNENLRAGVWQTAICYLILKMEKDAEAHGYKPDHLPEELDEEEEDQEKRTLSVIDWLEEYGRVKAFFVGKFGAGVQQVDAREHFRAKMRKKEEEVLKPELEAKAAQNGGGRDE